MVIAAAPARRPGGGSPVSAWRMPAGHSTRTTSARSLAPNPKTMSDAAGAGVAAQAHAQRRPPVAAVVSPDAHAPAGRSHHRVGIAVAVDVAGRERQRW